MLKMPKADNSESGRLTALCNLKVQEKSYKLSDNTEIFATTFMKAKQVLENKSTEFIDSSTVLLLDWMVSSREECNL